MIAQRHIFHVATPDAWQRAQPDAANAPKGGTYAPEAYAPSGYSNEGFIHCCSAAQLAGVLERYFSDASEVLLLTLDPALLGSPVRYEEGRPGEMFPHVYGPIELSAVLSATTLHSVGGAWDLQTEELE